MTLYWSFPKDSIRGHTATKSTISCWISQFISSLWFESKGFAFSCNDSFYQEYRFLLGYLSSSFSCSGLQGHNLVHTFTRFYPVDISAAKAAAFGRSLHSLVLNGLWLNPSKCIQLGTLFIIEYTTSPQNSVLPHSQNHLI